MSNPLFGTIPLPKLNRSSFNLSHEKKLTCEMGKLVPILCVPGVPGDSWSVQSELMIRVAPMLAPIMHRVNVYVHYFKVPCRLLWDNFQDFITGGKDGTLEPALPVLNLNYVGTHTKLSEDSAEFLDARNSSLWDYLGLPSGDDIPSTEDWNDPDNEHDQVLIQMLPFYAYQLIYNEYYRDENLDEEVEIPTHLDGALWQQGLTSKQINELLKLRNRAWEKDYFSGALPWPQRGEDVELPIAGSAPVYSNLGNFDIATLPTTVDTARYVGLTASHNSYPQGEISTLSGSSAVDEDGIYSVKLDSTQGVGNEQVILQGKTSLNKEGLDKAKLYADMSQVTSATINELRRAFALQRFLERNARGGCRYIEQIEAHFGVRSSDARLQRPEYLGGGKAQVVISEVLQTSSDSTSALLGDGSSVTPIGEMYGHGISVGNTMKCRTFCEEHCYIMGIMSIVPKPTYQQGVPRDFLRKDKYDFFWPEFAHLGEQEIWQAEIYAKSNKPDSVFGYTPRYAEYKYIPSTVHGDFKGYMNYWHLGRVFENEPELNSEFVHVDETKDDLARIFSAQFEVENGEMVDKVYQHFWCMIYNKIHAKRPMPRYGIPKL